MRLSEINLPISYEWGTQHAIVFTSELAQQLGELHQEYGNPNIVPTPLQLTDSRFILSADILTECIEGGLLYSLYSKIDKALFDQIDVLPMNEVLPLMPIPDMGEINITN